MRKNFFSLSTNTIVAALLAFLVAGNTSIYEVTGRLVDSDGNAIAGHQVLLVYDNDHQLATGHSNEQGYFSLTYQFDGTSADPFDDSGRVTEFRLGSSYPNPFNPVTTVPFHVPEATQAIIGIYDILGRQIMETRTQVGVGTHHIEINLGGGLAQGQYLLRVRGNGFSLTRSMTYISAGISSGTAGIVLRPAGIQRRSMTPARIAGNEVSRTLHLVLVATHEFETKRVPVPFLSNHDTGELALSRRTQGKVTDIDGNSYRTTVLGNQEWMAGNLQVTRYNDGSQIPTGLNDNDWENTTTGAYTVYPHERVGGLDSAGEVVQAYGKLYNWFAANDARGLCPDGWRVPDEGDWNELLAHLQTEHQIENTNTVNGAGNALKSCRQVNSPLGGECDTPQHPRWNAHGTHYGSDLLGFSALPGGLRELDGSFYEIGELGYWWTANEGSADDGKFIDLNNAFGWVWFDMDDKQMGLSVRCINDADVSDPAPPPETEKTYHENFQANDESGWVFLTPDGEVSVQNSELRFSTNDDEIVHMLLPIEATRDDFSFRVVPGSLHQGIESGGFGRAGFKSVITYHIEDEISVMYTEDILSHADGELTTLATYPVPDNLSSMQLDVSREGNNMHIRAYANDHMFYSGVLQHVDEGLFSGQMVMYVHKDETGSIPVSWSLDEVRVDYIPYLDVNASFHENFTNMHAPWFRSGDPDIVAQSITIANNRLNFNARNIGELSVLSPMGPVQDFTIEAHGGARGSHDSEFAISRMFDYKNYISVFFDDDELFLGYAHGSISPQILAEVSIHPGDVSKLKFSGSQIGTDLQLSVWANDQLVLTGTIPNVPRRLATGHLAISYLGGSVTDSYLDYILIEQEYGNGGDGEWPRDTETAVVEVITPTGRVWMDRNLGASRVATASDDEHAYGDLYQWGRAADGHQKRNSPATSTLSSSDQPGHGNFILAPDSPYDWRSPQNDNLWQGAGGTNNPCPVGYRLPTEAEWMAEVETWNSADAAGALASPLKLPMAGGRNSAGVLFLEGSHGGYWSGTIINTHARLFSFNDDGVLMGNPNRALARPVRCIKD
ncbi:FISUMP domain-containing protein [Balneolales bacterium ANBcel1]|nr:FISUMP domain-containing protein [Balneolales bacterium ANBcel1]